jgi:hypothetical protein
MRNSMMIIRKGVKRKSFTETGRKEYLYRGIYEFGVANLEVGKR